MNRKIKEIEKHGKSARGNTLLKKYLKGGKLAKWEAILAKCAECSGYYADARVSCGIEECPLYPFMPYR